MYNNVLGGTFGSIIGNGRGDWSGTVISGNVLYNPISQPGAGVLIKQNQFVTGTPPINHVPDPVDSGGSGASGSGGQYGNGGGGDQTGNGQTGGSTGNTAGDGTTPSDVPATLTAAAEISAATFNSSSGATVAADGTVSANGGNWIRFDRIDFGTGVKKLQMQLAAARRRPACQAALDTLDGRVLGSLSAGPGKHRGARHTQTAHVGKVTGVHALYLVFSGKRGPINLDWFSFK